TPDVARIVASLVGLERGDVHGDVGELKRAAGGGVVGEKLNALGDAFARAVRLVHEVVAGLLQARSAEGAISLGVYPLAVGLNERRERVGQSRAVELRQIRH